MNDLKIFKAHFYLKSRKRPYNIICCKYCKDFNEKNKIMDKNLIEPVDFQSRPTTRENHLRECKYFLLHNNIQTSNNLTNFMDSELSAK